MTQTSCVKEDMDSVVAVALRDGHDVRADVAALLHRRVRLLARRVYRDLTAIGDTKLSGGDRALELDLNRPREKVVYLKPKDA